MKGPMKSSKTLMALRYCQRGMTFSMGLQVVSDKKTQEATAFEPVDSRKSQEHCLPSLNFRERFDKFRARVLQAIRALSQ